MKKNIFIFLSLAFLAACSTQKSPEDRKLGLKRYTSYYNTLFNSKDALETELTARRKAYQDNFYAPYIRLLRVEDLADDGTLATDATSEFAQSGDFPPGTRVPQQQQQTSVLDIAAAKAEKAIKNYSVTREGAEHNKTIFDAYILLAQARLYMDKPLEALDALNYLFSNMRNDKRLDLARLYQAKAYADLKDYYKANEIFSSLDHLSKSEYALKTVYYSQMLVDSGKKEEALTELENAFKANGNRALKSRIAFLRGQVLAALNKKDEARESFTTAYKLANDFEFEVKSQVEIAKTFSGKADDYESAKNYLEGISKKGTYASRRNEFYYALGLMAQTAGKNDEAQEFYHRALSEKMSDPQLRGLTYYKIGKNYFDKNDYIAAGAYYDSATAAMTYSPTKTRIAEQAANIASLRKNFYLVKKNDSILNLTSMNDAERRNYFSKYIDQIRSREAAEQVQAKRDAHQKGFDTGDYSAATAYVKPNVGFQDFGNAKSGFYFSNQNTVASGETEFRQVWGDRANQDNWRSSSRAASLQDMRSDAMGNLGAKDPRRFEADFYIEKIPTDAETLANLKIERDTASLGLGRMYHDYFGNTALATKTLYALADNNPEKNVKLQALYQIFAMNYQQNPAVAERAKNMILSDFPYTSYSEFVKNPRNTSFVKSAAEVEEAYRKAFALYSEGKFEESKASIETSLAKYPKDALVPKFTLLNAYNTGKTAGKEIMILQLQQLALNYANTPEGERAKSILSYMKSDMAAPADTFAPTPNADTNGADQPVRNYLPPGAQVEQTFPQSAASIQTDAVPQINTTQNVIQPGQPLENNQNHSIRQGSVRPPVTSPGSGIGVPEMSPEELKKANTR